MGVVQRASGSGTVSGDFSVTLPAASSASNRVVVIITGNTAVATPTGWTLRTSQVNYMGHYLWDRAGGSASYTFNASGQVTWFIEEVEAGVYVSALSQNDSTGSGSYSTPNLTPTAGERHLLTSLGSTHASSARTLSGWTGGFVEQADLCVATADFPMGGYADQEVTANGSTAYGTTGTYSLTSPGRTAIIGAYETSSGGGVTATPTGIASGLTFGAVVVALALAVSPTGVATTEAFGTPTATTTLTASLTGIASAEAFGAPVVTIPITASPAGVASGETFGTPAAIIPITATPDGIGTGETFGALTVSTALTSSPTGIASIEAFGTVTVSMAGNVSPTGIPSAEAFGSPTAIVPITASPTGIGTGETFGSPTATGALTASPTGISTGETFGTPTVAMALTATPDRKSVV